LTYKTFLLTGLRKSELASFTVAQLHLDDPDAYAVLDAADEKNREGSIIPIRGDPAADLRDWLAEKLKRLQNEARRLGKPIPARLPGDMSVFNVPVNLLRCLNRDLKLAGIPKRDERGRTLDLHALRTTFGTLMSKGGVAPRTAQAAMRHSDIRLTMGVYTDPKLLDVRGALDVLPALSLDAEQKPMRNTAKVTGTDAFRASPFAPGFAPTPFKSSKLVSIPDRTDAAGSREDASATIAASGFADKRKGPLTMGVISGPSVYPQGDSNFWRISRKIRRLRPKAAQIPAHPRTRPRWRPSPPSWRNCHRENVPGWQPCSSGSKKGSDRAMSLAVNSCQDYLQRRSESSQGSRVGKANRGPETPKSG
jgi:hypothetical protein